MRRIAEELTRTPMAMGMRWVSLDGPNAAFSKLTDCLGAIHWSVDQTAGLDAQARDLKAAGAERLFREQVSSVAKRAKLAECLVFLRDGDALTVTKPDRLARSTTELLSIEADLSKRGVGLVVLSMGGERLDTRNPTSKLMLTILADGLRLDDALALPLRAAASEAKLALVTH